MKPTHLVEKTYTVWGCILILWAFYRWYFHLPEAVDELLIKPLLFVLPVFVFVRWFEKKPLTSLGFIRHNFWQNLYVGLGIGSVFVVEALAANFIKYGTLSVNPKIATSFPILASYLLFSLATAFSEETLVRGFFYGRLVEGFESKVRAGFVSIAMYVFLLIPIVFTQYSLEFETLGIFVFTMLILALVNTLVFDKTKSLVGPILIHAFWNMVVLLYL